MTRLPTPAAHPYWLNAGARNIVDTTASTGRCPFMRKLPRVVDVLDLIVCAALIVAMIAYAVLP